MKIQLNSWKVNRLNFQILEEDRHENSFKLRVGHGFDDEDDKIFFISFDVVVEDKEFNLDLEANFIFSTDEVINEEFKKSNFPKINAPAIAFPFLRAFISNMTLQSGFDPVMLPSINFVKMEDKEESYSKN